MAQQSDISSILAALANQGTPRPGGAPGLAPSMSQPPPSIAQPYGAVYPVLTPPPAGSAFALPQPTSSGSVDLSNIKPSNSGSVNLGGSLADAISRARGIAASKGLAYDASREAPPREGRGSYRRSRSRSRSPLMRFRDNYNPYRDERRDDPRRAGSYPRDRSFSPGVGGRSTGPPPVRAYNNPSETYTEPTGDAGTETMTIESNLVGLIIGRQGENLRRVETDTSTRVQFLTGPEATGPTRQCRITGTRAAREDAKAEIARIIAENGNPARGNVPPDRTGGARAQAKQNPPGRGADDSLQIMVPNRTVGLIIGRGGETIKDLQERSGCHVNILGEDQSVNGLRPVNLIGSPQAQNVAKNMIMEVVDSDNKNLASGGPSTVRASSQAYSGPVAAGDNYNERVTDTIMVPSEAVGMIIGKGGETIRDMQSNTGCKINVAQPSGQDYQREIGLVGTRSAIELAKNAIMEKVHAVEEKNRGGGRRDNQFDQYSQPQQQNFSQQGGYGQPSYQQPQQPGQQYPPQGGQPGPSGADDPYGAYGGYQNYLAMWYAAAQQQQQGQQQSGQPRPS